MSFIANGTVVLPKWTYIQRCLFSGYLSNMTELLGRRGGRQ